MNKFLKEMGVNIDLMGEIDYPIWQTDIHGKLLYFNKSFELLYFYKFRKKISTNESLTSAFSKIIEISWEKLVEKISKGEKNKLEIQFSYKNNKYFFELSYFPVIDQYSKAIHSITFFAYDVTDRKKSISILHKAKSQLQALINNMPALVWLADEKGNFLISNQLFQDFFELNNEFNNIETKIPVEKKDFFYYLKDDFCLKEQRIRCSEEKKFIIGNEIKWFELHKTPIINDNGIYIGFSGIALDITTRKTIENILLESEEKFRQFAENTSDSFILFSPKEILYVNPAFEKIYGRIITNKEISFHIPAEWIHPDDREKIKNYFKSEDYLKTGKFNGQYRIITPEGDVKWIWERSFPVRDESGNISRYIAVASDITRQKQLETELLINQAQQQAILDNIPNMAWLKDISGRYVSVNEAFALYYKKSKEEILGKTDAEICNPDLAELYAYNDYLVITTKKQQQFDEFIDTHEGTIYKETIKTPVFDSEGRIIGITGISRDITQYKRMEQQLRENDDRVKTLLLHATESITVIDIEGRVIFDTNFFYRIAGIKSEDCIGLAFTEYIAPSDEALVLYAINKVIENPSLKEEITYSCVKPDGEIIYFKSCLSNHLQSKLIGGIVINTHDITQQKIAEVKEKTYQHNVNFLEKTALEFLSISSSDEIYQYIGDKIREIIPDSVVIFSSYNQENDSLTIQNLSGLNKYLGVVYDLLGRDPINYTIPLNSVLKRRLTLASNKLHELNGGLYNITNRQIDFMVCKALEKLISMNKAYGMGIVRSDKLLGSIIILTRYEHEISDPRIIETFMYQASIALSRRRLEKELIKAKEKAEESDRLKTAFLANMSHEIRTPINGIIGFSQLLEQSFDDNEKRKEFLQIIRTNANMLLNLIDDIIDVSRIQEGQVRLKKTIVNINLLLDDILTPYMNPIAQGKNIITKIEKSLPDEEAIVLTDPLRLKQILNNLISNAFKFTERGAITVGYTVDRGMILFYVADTGIGIPEDKLETIFLRFTQADSSLTRRYGGSGLGLAISKGLVELMGGKIWVESTVGLGTKFYFSIPSLINDQSRIRSITSSIEDNPLLMN